MSHGQGALLLRPAILVPEQAVLYYQVTVSLRCLKKRQAAVLTGPANWAARAVGSSARAHW